MGNALDVLIVDDEPQSRLLVRKLLEQYQEIGLVSEAGTLAEAREYLQVTQPGLVFLDVQLRNESGFGILEQLDPVPFGVIFITGHSEYAVRAFRYNAIDYLVKPLDPMEFDQAVSKALLERQAPGPIDNSRLASLRDHWMAAKPIPDKLTVPTSEGFLILDTSDILYCKASSNYTEFYLAGNQKVVSSYTLGYYDEVLSGRSFFRVHRSYLINLEQIRMYRKGEGGTIVMQDGTEIEVSRGNKEAFLRIFRN